MPIASVAIFSGKVDSLQNSKPEIPIEVFHAVNRVMDSKSIELVRTRSGMFIVQYSTNGPFREKIGDDWLPVYVARVEQWRSGGIMKKEMEDAIDGFSSAVPGNGEDN